jgi:hypothetical protein
VLRVGVFDRFIESVSLRALPSTFPGDVETMMHTPYEARADADAVVDGPRRALGPPWTKDHRIALAATVVAG